MMGNLSGIVIGAWILVTAIVVIIDIAGGLNIYFFGTLGFITLTVFTLGILYNYVDLL